MVLKVGDNGAICKLLCAETAVQKDFAQKSIFWKVDFEPKIPYLRNELDFEKVEEPKTEK